ncbi:RagB/SusD family nutrient uptake outer membrane protein [Sinomicrobium weinanense]|uniref:RagB/SusD family nutrient uptake outer membrane protein n=1 Tax=Sinomicrobium weinanense TaxID=2842200 RepID=A0A926JTC8_9FLAO|nr:RagB/SusD family nutrient uptake outer membrane protein [Sinomicrobium weinanense]MBC9797011.1 RagB/SusD family nutrient uptake outer membrane protein [Sinomicrobium weinanense]MBU3123291.1 RagB/SusD family nutrient uptake outer membrane protein [Sinomicrobium weinanense]
MKSLTIKKIYIFLLPIILFYGCSEDFLDVESRERIEAEDSDEVFEPDHFIISSYGMLTDWTYAFSYLGVTEIISDNADKGSTPTSTGTDKHFLDGLTHTATTPSIRAVWEHWYKSIGRASYAIEYTEEYGLSDENYKNRLIAEAKFLRALHYFWLVRAFGDVPLQHVDLLNRAPKEEVYDFIEQDLSDAIAALPNKSEYASGDLGRATKGAAQALLAKVYLYKEQWEDALNYANMVMTSGEYSLEPNYEDIWRKYSENGVESIFEVQARGEQIAHGVQQYSQTQAPRGTGGWGWGFNIPSEDLLNAFNAEGDTIRRDATIIFRGETLWDGREVSGSVENAMYNEKAYSSANLGDSDGDKNVRILRLAEVLLIHAEAANELGNASTALSSLNQVRSRVNLPEVTTTDQGQLRQLIWKERRLELAFEHDRWFDLIRTGQAGNVMRTLGKPFEDGKHELFPVPNDQINQTPEMTQNPGW